MGRGLAAALKSARSPQEFLSSPAFQKIDVKRLLSADVQERSSRLAKLRAKGHRATAAERREIIEIRQTISDLAAKANILLSLQMTARRRALVSTIT